MKKNHAKRRKDKYNPYTIYELNHKYYLEFLDGQQINHCMEISQEIYSAFNSFELEDIRYLNVLDRHLEQSKLYERTFERRSQQTGVSAEDEAIQKITAQELYDAITSLSKSQRYRLSLYYFVGLTYEQIAKIENCSLQAVAKSISLEKKKLKKMLK